MDDRDKKIDAFTKSILKEVDLETPSVDFVANVMNSVKTENEVITYKPLISKASWFIISCIISILCIITYYTPIGFSILDDWNLSKYFVDRLHINIAIPTAYMYGFFFLCAFVWIQIKLIQRQHQKQLQ